MLLASASITATLGLNLTSFLLYGLAFLITVGILAKFVWPPLTRILDAKVDELEAASRLKKEAEATIADAQTEADKVLKTARQEAETILDTARSSASKLVSEAETRARTEAERIARDNETKLDQAWHKAQTGLRQDAGRLVALATERLLGEKTTSASDSKLIEQTLSQIETKA